LARRREITRAIKKNETVKARLETADRALKKGDVSLAAALYRRVAKSRPKNRLTSKALGRIKRLQSEANKKLYFVSNKLERIRISSEPSKDGKPWQQVVRDCFEEGHKLRKKYRSVPISGRKIANTMNRLRNVSLYKEALHEPEAAKLLAEAKKLEADDKVCCAFYIYRETAKLVPAPSALVAMRRFKTLGNNKLVVKAAIKCRELQWCHRTYRKAESMAKILPAKAKVLFTKVVDRSPRDSRIHVEARQQIAKLSR